MFYLSSKMSRVNLFHRDMPRLSVDIDLTYLPIENRAVSLHKLTQAMKNIAEKLQAKHFDVVIKRSDRHIIKLLVSNSQATIKIEPNLILRGTAFDTTIKDLSTSAQNTFLQTQKVKMVSIADLYAGKICAALDRQHPRDLFDIKLLFDHEGLTHDILQAFVVYLASSPRPMGELLFPNELDLKDIFHKEFVGMTDIPVSYDELHDTRKKLINMIHSSLQKNERDFLISLKSGDPQWDLLSIPHLAQLPAIQWKLLNIRKMDVKARAQALDKLKAVLDRDNLA